MKRPARAFLHPRIFATGWIVCLLLATTLQAAATPIDNKYAQLGGSSGFLGTATTPESTLPDGVGSYRDYQNGSIYYHPSTGAHEVHGLIRKRWRELNAEQGYLGYPMSDEIDLVDGSGRVSKFQGGQLMWLPAASAVSEVKSTDLVIDWPFAVNEAWQIIQANDTDGGSHSGSFVYCWDMQRAGAGKSSGGLPIAAAATARIVFVDDGLPSGDGNIGNVVIQRFGEGRYGSYLHIEGGSYTSRFASGPGPGFLPQGLPWENRPVPSSGTELAAVGDTGTGVGNFHLHFCVTTTPDRRGVFGPFESVPVAFRNYSFSSDSGGTWTYVSVGVPKNGQWVRRETAKSGQKGDPQVSDAAKTISFGTVKGKVVLTPGDGRPTGMGKLKLVVSSAWGEPLKTATVEVPLKGLSGPWAFEIKDVPAFNGLRIAVSYSGPWSRPFNLVSGESGSFDLAPNGSATQTLRLTTSLI